MLCPDHDNVISDCTVYQGDPRRPYPTDIEMRGGFLARAELPLSQQLASLSTLVPPPPPATTGAGHTPSAATPSQQTPGYTPHHGSTGAGQFSWSQAGEMQLGGVSIETGAGAKLGEDQVEVMSTDSSSSSSTDSN